MSIEKLQNTITELEIELGSFSVQDAVDHLDDATVAIINKECRNALASIKMVAPMIQRAKEIAKAKAEAVGSGVKVE